MVRWVTREEAAQHPLALDKILTRTGENGGPVLAATLSEARRLIREGAIYLNNTRLIPPEGSEDLIPVAEAPEYGL
jgi:hypothetical protein